MEELGLIVTEPLERSLACAVESLVWPTGLECSKAIVSSRGRSLSGGEPRISCVDLYLLDGHVNVVMCRGFAQQFSGRDIV